MTTIAEALSQLLGDQKQPEEEPSTPKDRADRQDFAARILASASDFHKSRPYLSPGIDIPGFTRRFCSEERFAEIAYGWSLSFNQSFFADLCYDGWLSICSYPSKVVYVLMPWIDPERCIMDFDAIHISKNVLKRSRKYTITSNQSFDGVVAKCIDQHGRSWLHEPMVALLKGLHTKGYRGGRKAMHFGVHSIELWDEKGELVAGDIGYTVGACYTSMTGFRAPGTVSAGTVQLVATCSLLRDKGYKFWDLGMVMTYKKGLGGAVLTRNQFLKRYHEVRDDGKCSLTQAKPLNAKEMIVKLRDFQRKLSGEAKASEEAKGQAPTSSSNDKVAAEDDSQTPKNMRIEKGDGKKTPVTVNESEAP